MLESIVSVVIPCYNHAGSLERAIQSALVQRFLHEVIIVDDCSTDDSYARAEDLCLIDPRIAVFKTQKNSGPAVARNFGSMFATGHYLAFLDSDDEYLPGGIEAAVLAIENSPGMKAAKFWIEFVDENGVGLVSDHDPRKAALAFSTPGNVVMTTESFREIGGFPEGDVFRRANGGEDVAFNQALAKFMAPLGRVDFTGYRCVSRPDDHLRRFLANTRVQGESFSFVEISDDQKPGGALELAIDEYFSMVEKRLAASGE